MNRPAAIYARVSLDRQKENQTIASQTAALIEYAESHGYLVPAGWVFEDDGYSGASLIRPGLEAMRDLAAQGQIEAALVYAPDRLSRKYAYQVLLGEEFACYGVSLVFLKAPSEETAEDQLLVQFQGMIAEYERAQIVERTRRGKRHKAQQGLVNVLGGAPYGYRYIKKSDNADAYNEINEAEAEIVRAVFDAYTQRGCSINAIARLLNQRQIPTRTATARWERSTVWGILRNPAYQGKACFGKTELRPRQRITRPLRQRNRPPNRNSANHERPRQEWIEIPVPALISENTFDLAQEQLQKNKQHSPRRTIEPTLLQRMQNLRKEEQVVESELRSLELASEDQSRYLRLAETLSEFRGKLRVRAEPLDTVDRQNILRLVVQQILVGADTIRIRHSIPVADSGPRERDGQAPPMNPAGGGGSSGYLLRTGRHLTIAGQHLPPLCRGPLVRAEDETAVSERGRTGPLRGRSLHVLRECGGCRRHEDSAAGASGAVWADACRGEDPYDGSGPAHE